jgi:hypothetical protein
MQRTQTTVIAVLALLGSGATLLTALMMVLISFWPPTPELQAPVMRAVLLVMAALCAAFGAWGLASGIGLLRRRNWARISTLVYGVLLMIGGFIAGGGAVVQRLHVVAVMAGAEAVVILGLGVWWVAWLGSRGAQTEFHPAADAVAPAPDPRALPLSFLVIAWLLVVDAGLGLLSLPLLSRVDMFYWMPSYAGKALLMLLLAAAAGVCGAGLLLRRGWARPAACLYFAVGWVNTAAFYLHPPQPPFHFGGATAVLPPAPLFLSTAVGSLAFLVVMEYFLLTRRAAYERAVAAYAGAQFAPSGPE